MTTAVRSLAVSRRVLLATLTVLGAACGGGGDGSTSPTPTPGPAAVASVAVSPTSSSLVPTGTTQLTATVRDASGAALSGRAIAWSSSAPTVASVSTDGLVTGIASGSASITATSEGRSASAAITVQDGAVIGPSGGVVTGNGGLAKITIPAGALSDTRTITITPLPAPPSPKGLVGNTAYELGPEGTTFAKPVTLEFKYPAVSDRSDSVQAFYGINRYTNGAWQRLPGTSVNGQTRTVKGLTSSFSTYGVKTASYLTYMRLTPISGAMLLGENKQFIASPLDQDSLPITGVTLDWTAGSGISVSKTGLVSSVYPVVNSTLNVGGTQWFQCDPKPCNFGTWNGVPMVGDSFPVQRGAQALVTVSLVPIRTVQVSPTTATMTTGQTRTYAATMFDVNSQTIPPDYRTITWTTSNSSIATVSTAGVVTAVGAGGPVTITAQVEGVTGTSQLTVTAPQTAVASIDVSPTSPTVERGSTVTLAAVLRDAAGTVLTGRPLTWNSLTPSVASVSQSGVVTALANGTAVITATSGSVVGGAQVTVIAPIPLVVGTPQLGWNYTCLLRSNNTTWCWGNGATGLTSFSSSYQSTPVPFTALNGVTKIAGGFSHACAVGNASTMCWGSNQYGQLGNGAVGGSSGPVSVSGPAFAKVAVGQLHSCGLTAGGQAYCWGSSLYTGDANGTGPTRATPVSVAGVPTFTDIAAGTNTTCAIGGATWCWGWASNGSLGIGGGLDQEAQLPKQVTGGGGFVQISGGYTHYCALTGGGDVWCWGSNSSGELGDGSQTARSAPVPVQSSVKFTKIAVGGSHTCALAQDRSAWCWGSTAETGDDAPVPGPLYRTTPVQVVGGHRFTDLSVGGMHTCGRTADGTWCWGSNQYGILGDGTPNPGFITFARVPVKVIFPN